MGGYPSAALQLRPMEQPDIAGAYQKAQSLKGMMQEQQIRAQQLQSGQLGLQEQQSKLADQQKMTEAYIQANGDPQKTIDLAAKAGVSADVLIAHKQAILKQQQEMATYDKTKLENIKAQSDMIGQHSQAVLALPPEQRPAALQQSVSQLAQQGVIPPEQASQLLQSAPVNDPQQLDQWLKVHGLAAMSAKDQASQILEKQKNEATAAHEKVMEAHAQATENKPTEVSLALEASGGNPEKALQRLDQSRRASRPVNNIMTSNDAKDIADAIQNGDQPPTLQGLYRNAGPVRAELARRGVPLAKMETDWKAVQKHIQTLNGPQQERLRQSITSAGDMLDKIDGLYAEWKQLAPVSGFKIGNHAALVAMKYLPGRAGAVATALDAQIADLTADLGNVYMGGNSPTDHSLGLAAKNLSSDWNPQTFEEGIKQAHSNLMIRKNSITHSQPMGVSENSPYNPIAPASTQQAAPASGWGSQFGGTPHQ